MSELELKITVRGTPGIGRAVRRIVTDGEKNDGVTLASDGYILDVVKVERADGLPLAIEDDFENWYIETFKNERVSNRDQVRKAYLAGRAVK